MRNRMMVYYVDSDTKKQTPVYIGNYDECFKFYIDNKVKYREDKKYLGLGGIR